MIDTGPAAWKDVNATLLGLGSIHHDLRVAYRKAVAAGAIRDDRGAGSYRAPLTYDRDRPLG